MLRPHQSRLRRIVRQLAVLLPQRILEGRVGCISLSDDRAEGAHQRVADVEPNDVGRFDFGAADRGLVVVGLALHEALVGEFEAERLLPAEAVSGDPHQQSTTRKALELTRHDARHRVAGVGGLPLGDDRLGGFAFAAVDGGDRGDWGADLAAAVELRFDAHPLARLERLDRQLRAYGDLGWEGEHLSGRERHATLIGALDAELQQLAFTRADLNHAIGNRFDVAFDALACGNGKLGRSGQRHET